MRKEIRRKWLIMLSIQLIMGIMNQKKKSKVKEVSRFLKVKGLELGDLLYQKGFFIQQQQRQNKLYKFIFIFALFLHSKQSQMQQHPHQIKKLPKLPNQCFHKVKYLTSHRTCQANAQLCSQKCPRVDHIKQKHDEVQIEQFVKKANKLRSGKIQIQTYLLKTLDSLYQEHKKTLHSIFMTAKQDIKNLCPLDEEGLKLIEYIIVGKFHALSCSHVFYLKSLPSDNYQVSNKAEQIIQRFKNIFKPRKEKVSQVEIDNIVNNMQIQFKKRLEAQRKSYLSKYQLIQAEVKKMKKSTEKEDPKPVLVSVPASVPAIDLKQKKPIQPTMIGPPQKIEPIPKKDVKSAQTIAKQSVIPRNSSQVTQGNNLNNSLNKNVKANVQQHKVKEKPKIQQQDRLIAQTIKQKVIYGKSFAHASEKEKQLQDKKKSQQKAPEIQPSKIQDSVISPQKSLIPPIQDSEKKPSVSTIQPIWSKSSSSSSLRQPESISAKIGQQIKSSGQSIKKFNNITIKTVQQQNPIKQSPFVQHYKYLQQKKQKQKAQQSQKKSSEKRSSQPILNQQTKINRSRDNTNINTNTNNNTTRHVQRVSKQQFGLFDMDEENVGFEELNIEGPFIQPQSDMNDEGEQQFHYKKKLQPRQNNKKNEQK